jgi:hypothetical protein
VLFSVVFSVVLFSVVFSVVLFSVVFSVVVFSVVVVAVVVSLKACCKSPAPEVRIRLKAKDISNMVPAKAFLDCMDLFVLPRAVILK